MCNDSDIKRMQMGNYAAMFQAMLCEVAVTELKNSHFSAGKLPSVLHNFWDTEAMEMGHRGRPGGGEGRRNGRTLQTCSASALGIKALLS